MYKAEVSVHALWLADLNGYMYMADISIDTLWLANLNGYMYKAEVSVHTLWLADLTGYMYKAEVSAHTLWLANLNCSMYKAEVPVHALWPADFLCTGTYLQVLNCCTPSQFETICKLILSPEMKNKMLQRVVPMTSFTIWTVLQFSIEKPVITCYSSMP